MRVLILAPDWRFARRAQSYLESLAHLVVVAPHAREAGQKVAHWQPDLVIVAAELCDSGVLENLHAAENPPAVLLTGWMDRYARVWRAWRRGGHELLMKPVFTTEELHQAIVTALENAAVGTRRRRLAVSA